MKEFTFRRGTWTNGGAVTLADRTVWFLPKIDLPLIMTTPCLGPNLAMAVQAFLTAEGGVASEAARMAHFHSHIADIGGKLLQRNYDFPDLGWKTLLSFGRKSELLRFTQKTSAVLNDSSRVWEPFLAVDFARSAAILQAN